jgi:hypothetical protein
MLFVPEIDGAGPRLKRSIEFVPAVRSKPPMGGFHSLHSLYCLASCDRLSLRFFGQPSHPDPVLGGLIATLVSKARI